MNIGEHPNAILARHWDETFRAWWRAEDDYQYNGGSKAVAEAARRAHRVAHAYRIQAIRRIAR